MGKKRKEISIGEDHHQIEMKMKKDQVDDGVGEENKCRLSFK